MRILSVIGTRPEAVKMAPIVRLLREKAGIESIVCVTAQHRQMLDQVLQLFDISPDIDLDLMRPNQSLAGITASIFTNLAPVLEKTQPDWILSQGDTTTVMVTALLAYYYRVRLGHVEAGLRTGDKWQPFPEEINRMVAGVAADLHFAPTEWSRQNLLKENVPQERIVVTGNPVIDALQWVSNRAPSVKAQELFENLNLVNDPRELILVTAHRRENFGEPILQICSALRRIAETYADRVRIVYPVHLNPNIQGPVRQLLGDVPNISLIEPVDYDVVVQLLKRAKLVLTDSGGLQEEAPGLGLPVLVLRDVTERPEAIHAGTVKLAGTDAEKIFALTADLLNEKKAYDAMAHAVNPYGDGNAAQRIVAALTGDSFVPFALNFATRTGL